MGEQPWRCAQHPPHGQRSSWSTVGKGRAARALQCLQPKWVLLWLQGACCSTDALGPRTPKQCPKIQWVLGDKHFLGCVNPSQEHPVAPCNATAPNGRCCEQKGQRRCCAN